MRSNLEFVDRTCRVFLIPMRGNELESVMSVAWFRAVSDPHEG